MPTTCCMCFNNFLTNSPKSYDLVQVSPEYASKTVKTIEKTLGKEQQCDCYKLTSGLYNYSPNGVGRPSLYGPLVLKALASTYIKSFWRPLHILKAFGQNWPVSAYYKCFPVDRSPKIDQHAAKFHALKKFEN